MTEKVIDFKERYELQKKKENIAAGIHQLQQDISAYKISELSLNLSFVIDELHYVIPLLSAEDQRLMNEILELLNTALENSDYLLFSDVLELELIRLLESL